MNAHNRVRFSLFTLFLITTAVAVVIPLVIQPLWAKTSRRAAIQSLTGDSHNSRRNGSIISPSAMHEDAIVNSNFRIDGLGLQLVGTGYEDDDLKTVKNLPELRELRIVNTSVTNSGLECLDALPELRSLSLFQSRSICDGIAGNLKRLKELRVLILDGTNVSDSSVADLGKLTTLTHLSLANSRISPSGARKLKSLLANTEITPFEYFVTPSTGELIEQIRSAMGSVEVGRDLRISKIFFDENCDDGLKLLLNHRNLLGGLTCISLSGQTFTSEGLKSLLELPSLQEVHLFGSRISSTEARQLSSKLSAKVVWHPLSDSASKLSE